jgi:glycosyltransferase involved in cell wall biosynthesis
VLSIDIVLATLGSREPELRRFLDSLAAQSHTNLRLIIVDQSPCDELARVIDPYRSRLDVLQVRAEVGLSRARNAGILELDADVVTFPDDDCWYGSGLLARVDELLTAHPQWHGVTGRVVDESGQPAAARWSKRAGLINRRNVWTRGTSISIFLRRQVVEQVGEFDETLGLGSQSGWESGEETDYLLRALKHRFVLHYEPTLTVFHPQARAEFTDSALATGCSYGMGMGKVLRKHGYPWWSAGYHVTRAVGGSVLTLAKARPREARFHWAVARGRARGWLGRESA